MTDDKFLVEMVNLIRKHGHEVHWDKSARMIERLGIEFYTVPLGDGKGDYLEFKTAMEKDCSVKRVDKENG